MKKFTIYLFLIISTFSYAQQWEWANIAPTPYCSDVATGIGKDLFGNVYVTEHSYYSYGPSGNTTVTYYYLYKYNSVGTLLWRDTLPNATKKSVTDLNGNTFVVGANIISKYDSSGSQLWSKVIPNTGFLNLCLTPTNGLIARGKSFLNNTAQTHILNLDSSGNIVWSNILNITTPTSEMLSPLYYDKNGIIYLTGVKLIGGTYKNMLFKMDMSGNVLSNYIVNDYSSAITVTDDNNIYLTGNIYPTQTTYKLYIAKYDTQCNKLWEDTLKSPYGYITDIQNSSNNDIYITGGFNKNLNYNGHIYTSLGYSLFVAKLTSLGDIVWLKNTISASGAANPNAFKAYSNNIVVAGSANGANFFDTLQINATNGTEMFVAKLNLNTTTAAIQETGFDKNDFEIYPNPGSGIFNIKSSASAIVSVYDMLGQRVKLVPADKAELDISLLPKGIYIIELNWKDKKAFKKIVLK